MAEPSAFSVKPETLKSNVLSGWKDIATYLGKGVRTAQRYERDLQLPVRRPAGNVRGSVIALGSELDEWVARSPTKPLAHATLNSLRDGGLKREVSTMRSLCAEARELQTAIKLQTTALQTGMKHIAQSVSGPHPWDGERYMRAASDQKERALEMAEVARNISDHAIEMRKPPRRRLIMNC